MSLSICFQIIVIAVMLLSGCQSLPSKPQPTTNILGDIDVDSDPAAQHKSPPQAKSKEDIRKAYIDYLDNAAVDEKTRLDALTRLAELEYQEARQEVDDQSTEQTEPLDSEQEKSDNRRLNKTIELLTTSIQDYPDADNNDVLLYQLARAQAESGQHDESIESLSTLAEKYALSPYYVEAQFRVAEDSFSLQDYSAAEYAYTEVIVSPGNDIFLEKSIFKRGWAPL